MSLEIDCIFCRGRRGQILQTCLERLPLFLYLLDGFRWTNLACQMVTVHSLLPMLTGWLSLERTHNIYLKHPVHTTLKDLLQQIASMDSF